MTHAPTYSARSLTLAMLEGVACVECGEQRGSMVPVDVVDNGQVFAHPECVRDAGPATPHVLVIGLAGTPADVAKLRDFARAVAIQVGAPAAYATDMNHYVIQYSAVYNTGTLAVRGDVTALVLYAEALATGTPVFNPLEAEESCELCGMTRVVPVDGEPDGDSLCGQCKYMDIRCAHCCELADDENMVAVERGTTWLLMHPGCAGSE